MFGLFANGVFCASSPFRSSNFEQLQKLLFNWCAQQNEKHEIEQP